MFIIGGMALDDIALQRLDYTEAEIGRRTGDQQDGAVFIVELSRRSCYPVEKPLPSIKIYEEPFYSE